MHLGQTQNRIANVVIGGAFWFVQGENTFTGPHPSVTESTGVVSYRMLLADDNGSCVMSDDSLVTVADHEPDG